jgi:hypothetical protein
MVSLHNKGKIKLESKTITKQSNGWIFKLHFCHSASLHFTAKVQLKNHRLSQRYRRQEIKSYSFGNIAKAKAVCFEECMFLVSRFGEFGFLSELKNDCFLSYASVSTSFIAIERTKVLFSRC